MTDDIVTRLHLEADEWCFDGPVRIFLEAADEIERLRAELKDADDDFHALKAMFDKMRAEVARLNTFLHPIGMVTYQAVRGE